MKFLIQLFGILTTFSASVFSGEPTFYWVQAMKSHPQHLLTRKAFLARCKTLKLSCQTLGTDENDIPKTLSLAINALEKGNVGGMSLWVGGKEWQPLIEKASENKIPIVLVNTPLNVPQIPGVTALIGSDLSPKSGIKKISFLINLITQELKGQKGSFAVTQGSFNDFEDQVATLFSKLMKESCPDIQVLAPVLEGFNLNTSPKIAASLIEKHKDLLGAFSTTALGAQTWASAQRRVNRKILVVGGNQLGSNLELVQSGEVFAIGWSPFIETAQKAADLFHSLKKGLSIHYRHEMDPKVVTRENVDQFIQKRDFFSKQIRDISAK